MSEPSFKLLEHVVIILDHPRDVVNIGGVVRAMKNMGFRQLRLVNPVPFDPADITGIAHRSEDVLAQLRTYTTLDAALADAVHVVGTTARSRGAHRLHTDVRALAPALLMMAAQGPVALLFGPEDNGLDNSALDRCHAIVSLPTDPAYPSLNLAQAALLLMHELRMAVSPTPPTPTMTTQRATAAQWAALMTATEQALRAIEFFKAGTSEKPLRSVRALLHRADPDANEVALLTAMAREVVAFLRRSGLKAHAQTKANPAHTPPSSASSEEEG